VRDQQKTDSETKPAGIDYTCICGKYYRWSAEIVQAGGKTTAYETLGIGFICVCGEKILDVELWGTPRHNPITPT
jgi:hypothetical protein